MKKKKRTYTEDELKKAIEFGINGGYHDGYIHPLYIDKFIKSLDKK